MQILTSCAVIQDYNKSSIEFRIVAGVGMVFVGKRDREGTN